MGEILAVREERKRTLRLQSILSLGGILYPILFYRLQPRIGFEWTVRVIGFTILGTSSISLAISKPRVLPAGRARPLFDPSAFRSPAFIVFSLGLFLAFVGIYFPFYYVSTWATQTLGTDSALAFYLLSILNAGSVLGRILLGLIADRIGPLNVMIPFLLLTSILGFAWVAVEGFGELVIYCSFYGFFSGAVVSLPPTVVAEICPDPNIVGTWMGMSFSLAGLGMLIGNPIAGAILDDESGSFIGAQCFSAAVVLAGAILICVARWLRFREGQGWIA